MRHILSLICAFSMMLALPFHIFAQDYYTGRKAICCNGTKYQITHYPPYYDILIENDSNHIRENPRYKIGSYPVIYYTEATGMGNAADADVTLFDSIVRQVFSDKEIALYSECSGFIYASYVVDSNNGKILEVRFSVRIPDEDKTLLTIPIAKFNKLETLLKERLVCTFSDELKKERQSYCISGNNLF